MFAAVSIRPGQLISEGILFVRLDARRRADRGRRPTIIDEVRKKLGEASPACARVALDLSTQGFTPTRGYPVNFAVQGPDWETVTQLAENDQASG